MEITLLPNDEVPIYFLWEKIYQQIHLALVEVQDTNKKVAIGAAFPEYKYDEKHKLYHLGGKLRLFAASKELLEGLSLKEWFSRLNDYVHITKIRDVPNEVDGYVCFKRIQPKSNNARLARRSAKRKVKLKGLSQEAANKEAEADYCERKEIYSQAPFIHIKSLSSDKQYRLMIAKVDENDAQFDSGFSTYGLSSVSTVPQF